MLGEDILLEDSKKGQIGGTLLSLLLRPGLERDGETSQREFQMEHFSIVVSGFWVTSPNQHRHRVLLTPHHGV